MPMVTVEKAEQEAVAEEPRLESLLWQELQIQGAAVVPKAVIMRLQGQVVPVLLF